MKTLIIIVFGFLLNQNSFGQNLKIELTNKTGFDIDSVAIGSKYVGLLKKNTSIIVESNRIAMQGGSIMGFPKGSIKGKKRHPQILECATGMKSITKGNYSFDIVMNENRTGYQLYYKRKLEKE
jgi:hypothetical protein